MNQQITVYTTRLLMVVVGVMLIACAPVITEKQRKSARINYDLGVASLNRGEHREALRALWAALGDDPELPEVHNALGLVLHAMGKQHDALKHYHEAVRLGDKFSEAYNNMGVLLLDMGRYKEAIAAFEQALSNMLYGTPYLAEGNMGWAYYKQGNISAAREHIGNAVATDPQFCRGYQWLARIAIEQNQPAEAVANSKRFKKHCLDNAEVANSIAPEYRREMQYYLGLGYLKQGQREPARQAFAQCASVGAEAGFAVKCSRSLSALQ